MFSSRFQSDLTPGRLQRALDELRAAGTPLIDLTTSNPPQCGLGPEAALFASAPFLLGQPQRDCPEPDLRSAQAPPY